jgi:hypothetical protein
MAKLKRPCKPVENHKRFSVPLNYWRGAGRVPDSPLSRDGDSEVLLSSPAIPYRGATVSTLDVWILSNCIGKLCPA